MSAHTKSWDETAPAGTDSVSSGDDEIRDLKVAVRERLELEHQDMDSSAAIEAETAAGRHIPGIVGVCFSGTTAQINALTGMGEGALAWDTTLSVLKRYSLSGTAWSIVTTGAQYAFRVTLSAAQTISAAGYHQILFDTETYDNGAAYDNATNYQFVAPATGIYLFTARASVLTSAPNISIHVYVNGTAVIHGNWGTPVSSAAVSVLSGMYQLTANDVVKLYIYASAACSVSAQTRYTAWEGIMLA